MKRIKDTGKSERKIDPETLAWQIIDDRDFWTLVDILKELKGRRAAEAHKSPWCECGRSELKGSCSVCDYED